MEQSLPTDNQPQNDPIEQVKKEETIKSSRNNGFLVVLLSILLIISVLIAGFFAYQTQKLVKEFNKDQSETFTPTAIPTQTPTPTVDPTANWQTYKNIEIGFEIKHPNEYKQVEDTYGWPNAILLLYKGGQSYDLVVELWDSKTEYLTKYNNEPITRLVAKQVGEKFVTFLNINDNIEVASIIETFKILLPTSPQP